MYQFILYRFILQLIIATAIITSLFALFGCATGGPQYRPKSETVLSLERDLIELELSSRKKPSVPPKKVKGNNKKIIHCKTDRKNINLLINDANRKATQSPVRESYKNSIQEYDYSEGNIYQILCCPGQITDIMLQFKESLTNLSAGDTKNWMVDTNSLSGNGKDQRIHILVKPLSSNLPATNMFISTDKRFYYLQLQTSKDAFMSGVSWTYPEDEEKSDKNKKNKNFFIPPGVDLESELKKDYKLNYNYFIASDSPSRKKLKVFDDGSRTYIQASKKYDILPLYILPNKYKNDLQLINYRFINGFYVVDKIIRYERLRLGHVEDYSGATILNSHYWDSL